MTVFAFMKKLVLFVLIVAVAIPLRYGSTNHQYLFIRLLHSTLSLKHSLLPDRARPTLSADYRAFEDLLRLSPTPKINPLADPIATLTETRGNMTFATLIPKSSDCQVKKERFKYGGYKVDAYWIDHRKKNGQRKSEEILLYLHGGGYVVGDLEGMMSNIFI